MKFSQCMLRISTTIIQLSHIFKSKCLLENHRILVSWIGITAETEVSETVTDIFSFVFYLFLNLILDLV